MTEKRVSGFLRMGGRTWNGGGTITLVSDAGVGRVFSTAVIGGRFTFPTAVPVGTYKVMVAGEGVPPQYAREDTSRFALTIDDVPKGDGSETVSFDLD